MDYFTKEIEEKIHLFDEDDKVKVYLQMRIEYILILILAYLWNKNFSRFSNFRKQGDMARRILKPTIGSIINLSKGLDIDNEFFTENNSPFFDYLEIRNLHIGHGYVMEDKLEIFSEYLERIFTNIKAQNYPIINQDLNLIYVERYNYDCNLFVGRSFTPEGRIQRWTCSDKVQDFKTNNIYGSFEVNNYFRLSPFIHIELPKKLFLFRSISHIITGKVHYNRIDESQSDYTKDWAELISDLSSNDGRRKGTPNGTIINVFENNYKDYIDAGAVKDQILDYLVGSRKNSSVAITVWGHGGVGKTATIQNICDLLSKKEDLKKNQKFDFVIFLSAKDRLLNPETVEISEIEENNRISTFDEIIEKVNDVIFDTPSTSIEEFVNFQKRVLLIIDDYETFPDKEKEKIVDFIELLNVNYHKVVLTTRNRFLEIGKGIPTNELNENITLDFLFQVLEKYYGYTKRNIQTLKLKIEQNSLGNTIHKVTSGRPLFIFIFANHLSQSGELSKVLKNQEIKRIESNSAAAEFLFGRIYDQLGNDKLAQNIFVVLGLVTPKDKLSSLINHIKYILNKQGEKNNSFELSLKKLVDLKIIEINDKFYKIYSNEILDLMKKKFESRSNQFKRDCISRFKAIERHLNKDTGEALLLNADNSRNSGQPEQYVIDKYQELLNIDNIPKQIKLKGLLNLTDYLYNSRGNKEQAVKKFEENKEFFSDFETVRRYSEYCWSIGDDEYQKKGIESLRNYLLDNKEKKIILSPGQKLRILALLVLRMSLYWLDKEEEQAVSNDKLVNEYRNILDPHGNLLFMGVKETRIDNLNPGERQDILIALLSLVTVLNKIPKLEISFGICTYILDEVNKIPSHIRSQFKKRLGVSQKLKQENFKAKAKKDNRVNPSIYYKGKVTRFFSEKGFGFIKSLELPNFIFFNENSVSDGVFETILEKDIVEFKLAVDRWKEVKVNHKGYFEATDLKVKWTY